MGDVEDPDLMVAEPIWKWQQTDAGEREVKRALRKSLLKYKLHTEQDLYDQAYGYIRQYY